jgi:hypothetical protein
VRYAARGAERTVIPLNHIATLDVAAASGLALVGDELLVVADDELTLHRYGRDGQPRGLVPLFEGELPAEPRARKKAKPDLEALTMLPDGRLLALGSGSKKSQRRDRGALVSGDRVVELDLAPLYNALRGDFDRLNVEGACVLGDNFALLTRRTGRRGRNALVRLDLRALLAALDASAPRLDAALLVGVDDLELGAVRGTPLGFTDATPWEGGILFTAVAEVTDDPVDDGACVACELGWMDRTGAIHHCEQVDPCAKLEGIAVDGARLYAVADADDRATLAPLYTADLPARLRS